MTVQQLINFLEQVKNKNVLVSFPDGAEIIAVHDMDYEVVLTDAESE